MFPFGRREATSPGPGIRIFKRTKTRSLETRMPPRAETIPDPKGSLSPGPWHPRFKSLEGRKPRNADTHPDPKRITRRWQQRAPGRGVLVLEHLKAGSLKMRMPAQASLKRVSETRTSGGPSPKTPGMNGVCPALAASPRWKLFKASYHHVAANGSWKARSSMLPHALSKESADRTSDGWSTLITGVV